VWVPTPPDGPDPTTTTTSTISSSYLFMLRLLKRAVDVIIARELD